MSEPASERALLRAFVWMRWRVLANGLSRRRRSGWQRLGAVAEVAGKVLLWSMAAGFALLLSLGAGFLPWALARAGAPDASADTPVPGALLLVVRLALAAFLALLLVVPAFQGLSRGTLGRTRLLLLPIPDRTLHALEVASHLGDPWLLMIVPPLAAVAVGAAVAVAPAGAVVMLLAGGASVCALAALSATATFGVELVLRNRRRAEALGLLLVLVWVSVVMLPGWLESRREARETVATSTLEEREGAEGAGEAEAAAETERRDELARRLHRFPPALQLVPSEAYSRALGLATAGRPGAALLPVGILALATFGLLALSRHLWRRLRASPPASGARTGATDFPTPPRVPGLTPAAAAVAWSQLRAFSRTLVGRMSLFLGPVAALLVSLMLRSDVAEFAFGQRALGEAWTGVALAAGGTVFALLSIQSYALNQFAVDGPGFSLSVIAPLPRREVILGKWAAGAVLATAVAVLTTGVMVSLEPAALPFWPAVLLGGLSGYLLLAPVGSWTSMLLPKAVDLGRLGKDAQPNQLGTLLGTLAAPLVLLPSVAVGVATYASTRSVWLLTLAELACAAAALGVARLLLGPVAASLARRQEAIHLALLER